MFPIEPLESRCLLVAGLLDPTFAAGAATPGVVVDDVPGGNNEVMDVAGTSRGGAVVASTFRPRGGKPARLMLHVFRGDGSLEPRFGTGGRLAMGAGPLGTEARAVAIQPDGKILVAAAVLTQPTGPTGDDRRGDNGLIDGFPVDTFRDWAVIRFLPSGRVDRTFGTGGVAQFDVGSFHPADEIDIGDVGSFALDEPSAIAVLPGGKILVNGYAPFVSGNTTAGRTSIFENDEFAILRLGADGRLDTTFGESGRATHRAGRAMSVAPDGGAVYVAGGQRVVFEDTGTVSDTSRITRLGADGTPDPQFATDGTLTLSDSPIGLSSGDAALAALSDGNVVVGHGLLTRLTPAGDVDETFGPPNDDGLAASGLLGATEHVLVQPDGRLVVIGTKRAFRGQTPNQRTILDPEIARRMPDGSPDSTFGTNGRTLVSSGPNFDFVAGAFGRGRTLYAAGTRGAAVALARFTGDDAPAPQAGAALAMPALDSIDRVFASHASGFEDVDDEDDDADDELPRLY